MYHGGIHPCMYACTARVSQVERKPSRREEIPKRTKEGQSQGQKRIERMDKRRIRGEDEVAGNGNEYTVGRKGRQQTRDSLISNPGQEVDRKTNESP